MRISDWSSDVCSSDLWGTLLAIDLKTRKKLWEVPLGSTRDLAPWPLWLKLGVPNLGGAVVTASGVVFIGATTDNFLRAFDRSAARLVGKACFSKCRSRWSLSL